MTMKKLVFYMIVVICAIGTATGMNAKTGHAAKNNQLFYTSFEDGTETNFVQDELNQKKAARNVTSTFTPVIHGDITNTVVNDQITGSKDFNEQEIKANLFDDSVSTKFLTNENNGKNVWVAFPLKEAKEVKVYALASANDEPGRDLKSWKLLGSNDSENWQTIDERKDQSFSERGMWKKYPIASSEKYKFYKLAVSENNGASMTQLAELRLGTGDKKDDPTSSAQMSSQISTGPKDALNQLKNKGWTGDKAAVVKGSIAKGGDAYSYNNIVNDVNIKVSKNTRLQYKVMPTSESGSYDSHYDYDYTPMYAAVDLEFADGTYLSDLKGKSEDGVIVSPQEQGESKTLLYNQWSQITVDLGKVANGKTVKRVLLAYHNPNAKKGKQFADYFDDIKLTNEKPAQPMQKVDYVNTLRGTNNNTNFSRGLTLPATTVPNGFNFWSPATNYNDNNNYEYQLNSDKKFQYMTVSHEPSYWVGDRGTWQFMVNTSIDSQKVTSGADIDHGKYASAFSHEQEIAKPQLYQISFPDKSNAAGATMKLTPTMHGAVTTFTFDKAAPHKNVVFDSARGDGKLTYHTEDQSFEAATKHSSNGMKTMYVYGKFDTPFSVAKVENSKQGIVSFDDEKTNQVEMKVATSFVSLAQAKHNYQLELEKNTFAQAQKQAEKDWNAILDRVSVKGATGNQLTTLYSNMYRLYMYPNLYSENAGTAAKEKWVYSSPYEGTDDKPVIKTGKLYANNGFWDTYRTTWPAYSLLSTSKKEAELVDGLVQHYRDQGWVPRWIAPGGTNSMVGTNSDIIFADAMMKNISMDKEAAYQSALKNASAFSDDLVNGGRKDLNQSAFLGYVPSEEDSFGLSWSMEGYINDLGLYKMAKKLGHKDEAAYYKNRALGYTEMFYSGNGVENKWFKGRKANGSWTTKASDFSPIDWSRDYTETDAYNMAVSVPQDGNGLAALYGGPKKLTEKIDSIVNTPGDFTTSGGVIHEMREAREVKLGQYGHSNQPSHHILYMYAFSSEPWKTQKYVRDILARTYVGSDFGQGYIGDEDNGEQSAWQILSSMGLYPLTLSSNQFVLGSPLFKSASIKLPNGKTLTVDAPNNSDKNVYVDKVTFNGKKITSLAIDYKTIMKGGTLKFNMSAKPNKKRGTAAKDKPMSLTKSGKTPTVKTDVLDHSSAVKSTIDNYQELIDNNSKTSVQIDNKNELTVSFNKAKKVKLLTLTNTKTKTTFKTIKVLGSQNGKKWQKVSTIKQLDFNYDYFTKPFLINPNSRKFKHYKLVFSGSGELGEVELLGNN